MQGSMEDWIWVATSSSALMRSFSAVRVVIADIVVQRHRNAHDDGGNAQHGVEEGLEVGMHVVHIQNVLNLRDGLPRSEERRVGKEC